MPAAEPAAEPAADPVGEEPIEPAVEAALDAAVADLERTVAHMRANGGGLPAGVRTTRLVGEPPYDVTLMAGNVIYRVGVAARAGDAPADLLRRAAEKVAG